MSLNDYTRRSLDNYYLDMLKLVASRSTCVRRQVGSIITDVKGVVLAMGYNGVPRKYPHCLDNPCLGANDPKGDSSRCFAVHAEQNAILQCADLERAYNIYTTASPCFTCSKLIANTAIMRVIFIDAYPDELGLDVLKRRGIQLIHG